MAYMNGLQSPQFSANLLRQYDSLHQYLTVIHDHNTFLYSKLTFLLQ